MAREGDPEDWAPTITLLRALRGWTKTQLAEASGIDKSQISRYELGKEVPSRRTQERLAATVGLPLFLLEPVTAFIRRLREAMAGQGRSATMPIEGAGLSAETKRAVLESLDRAVGQARAELKLRVRRS